MIRAGEKNKGKSALDLRGQRNHLMKTMKQTDLIF
jgi:hypothetical protein